MASSSKYDKRSLQSLFKRVGAIDGIELEAGFFEEDRYGPENDNLQVAEVAWIQERGAGREIPSRPFMETSFNDLQARFYAAGMARVYQDLLGQGRLTKRLLNDLGDHVVSVVKMTIEDWTLPPNSKAWAEFKGKNDPLVYTGKMSASVKFKVEKK